MLTYSFASKGENSLYEHLYRCIKEDIENGNIEAGEKLPSKRSFAAHLGVSLITVEGAYAQLLAEGYLRSEPRRGYYACDLQQAGLKRVNRSAASTAGKVCKNRRADLAFSISEARDNKIFADLTGAATPTGAFPYGSWAKSLRDALVCEPEEVLIGRVPAAGTERLRKAIAEHLRGFRGLDVDPSCIVVGAGSQVLYNFIVQLLGRDKRYGVEDPGYERLRKIYQANNVSLSEIALDSQGVHMKNVEKAKVDVLHLMPSHQYPTGIVTSISRRYELLTWASEQKSRYIIEDDYDCEFRLTGRPIPSLQSIDALGNVIYVNTFTKSLGPAFRIGYMVLPQQLAQEFSEKLSFYSCTVSAIDQLALARIIESGEYERHINRMRKQYRLVRDEFIGGLRSSKLGSRMSISAEDAGIHFLLHLVPEGNLNALQWERAFKKAAEKDGVAIRAVSDFFAAKNRASSNAGQDMASFVVSYDGLKNTEIVKAVKALEKAAITASKA